MLVIPAFRVRIWSAIMHVSLVCVINSFSLYLLYIYLFSYIRVITKLPNTEQSWDKKHIKTWQKSVLIVFSFFFEYDLKHNRTRKCCARNSWFFCTILHCYHNRLFTNYFCWFFVTRPTKTKLSKKFYQLNENKKYHTVGGTVPKSNQKL
jgi:hypothetical protein